MHRGYVKDWRRTDDSPVWRMPPIYHRIWCWLIRNASHKEHTVIFGRSGEIKLRRGQLLTSVRLIARDVSWQEDHKKREPNPKTVYRVLQWLVSQMIIVESVSKTTICCGSRNGEHKNSLGTPWESGSKCLSGNTLCSRITIVNYSIYQATEEGEGNTKSNSPVTGRGSCTRMEKNKKKSCGTLASLRSLLASTTEFSDLPESTRNLILCFVDKARASNKTGNMSTRRVHTILADLVAISGETSSECLDYALEVTIKKAEGGQFTFSKQNVTGYVKAVARSRHERNGKAEEKYEPEETDVDALYR
jgi:hypothetical protein